MDEGSSETVKAELSIFDSLPYQVTHVKGDWIKVDQKKNCYGTNTGTPLIFEVPRSPGLYVDLSNSFVEVQLNLVQGTAAHTDVISRWYHMLIMYYIHCLEMYHYRSIIPKLKVKILTIRINHTFISRLIQVTKQTHI